MKILFLTPIFVFFFISCSNSDSGTEKSEVQSTDSSEVVADTLADSVVIPELSEDLVSLLQKKTKEYDLPFELDSVGFAKLSEAIDKRLNSKEIKLLSQNLLDHEYTEEVNWRVEHLLKMEERKRKGGYEEYLNSLDIGMLRDIEASMGPILRIDEHSFMILWKIEYGSYEACPYYSGTLIIASLVYQNELKNSILVGEVSGGADAPVWGDTEVYSTIDSKGIRSIRKDRSCEGEEDEEGNEIIEEKTTDSYIHFEETGFRVEKEGNSK
ncbi:MAG: hypothetical protein KDC84_10805 [Crocinitomicaceae bacterium]|nr:hypothetical protein [Crocinitomicaceae bacterium]